MNTRSDKTIGLITVVDESVHIEFRYNTDCFKTISKIPGATYSKESKQWKVSLTQLPRILESKSFSRDKFHYDFDEVALKEKFSTLSRAIVSARERTQKNPFSVLEEDISLLSFDVVFRISPSSEWILLTVGKSQKARRFLKTSSLVHYAKKARGYLTTGDKLPQLLKVLRDKEIAFAVESNLSAQLAESAPFRSEAIKGNRFGVLKDYQRSLLFPIIDTLPGGDAFTVVGMTAELKARLLPQRAASQGRKAESFSRLEAVRLLYRAKLSGIQVWRTQAVQEIFELYSLEASGELHQSFDRFRDELLALTDIPLCWRLDSENYGGIQIAKSLWQKELSKILSKISSTYGGAITEGQEIFIRVQAVKLPHFFEEVQKFLAEAELGSAISRDFRVLLEVLKSRAEILEKQRSYHELKDVELNLPGFEKVEKLYPHQRVAVSWLLDREYGMLGDDMGLGKTLSVLVAFSELLSRKSVDFLLVVCPNSLVNNWLREAQHWAPHLKFRRLPDTKAERTEVLTAIAEGRYETIDGLVINFESMRIETVWPLLKAIAMQRKTFLCIDESQRIKNPQSQSFQAMKEISAPCVRRVLLSGTPTPRDITDIWGQMLILDKGERFGKNYYNWLTTVAELGTQWSEYAVKRFLPDGIEETISRVHEVLLRRKKEDVIKLPEKIFMFRDVEMTGDQKKRYEQIRDELRIQVRTLSGEVGSRVIESVLEQYLRAVQVASNPRLIDPSWKGEPAKFKELDDIVEDVVAERGEKLVIWSNYLTNISEITERYAAHGARPFSGSVSTDERAKSIAAFQSDKKDSPKILVAVPAAGGVGITLTAAQTAVYLDRTWNAEHWLQSIDRIHRIGQKATARIIVLNASKVDELIGYNLKRKAEQMEKVLSGVGTLDKLLFPTISELLEALS